MELHQEHSDTGRRRPMIVRSARYLMICAAGTILIAGCAATTHEGPSIVQRVEGEKPAPPAPTGFLGDYSLLKPGAENQTQLRYVNPQVDWSQYDKIILSPVTFWGDDTTKVSAEEQQALSEYFYTALKEQLGKKFTLVSHPGPGVMRISVAITDAAAAIPVLRTISVLVPQAHALNMLKNLATGTYAFVGSAQAEAKITDSVTGQLMGEFVDKRFGTAAIATAATWQWQDAKRAMDAWSEVAATRLAGFRSQGRVASNSRFTERRNG